MTHLVGRTSSGHHLPQQDAEAPDVALAAELVLLDALGRHPLHGLLHALAA